MDESELVAKYPTCFHLASADAWDGIRQQGLLSTRALLEVWEVPPVRQTRLTTQLRKGPERNRPPSARQRRHPRPAPDERGHAASIPGGHDRPGLAHATQLLRLLRPDQAPAGVAVRRLPRGSASGPDDQHRSAGRRARGPHQALHLKSGIVRHVCHTRVSDTFQPIARFVHQKAGGVAQIGVQERVPITDRLALGAEIWHPDAHREVVPDT